MPQTRSTHSNNIRSEGHTMYKSGGGDAVYGLGLIGALVYFIQHADSFWAGVLGILKAIVWPAFLVYELLGSVGL